MPNQTLSKWHAHGAGESYLDTYELDLAFEYPDRR